MTTGTEVFELQRELARQAAERARQGHEFLMQMTRQSHEFRMALLRGDVRHLESRPDTERR